MWLWPVTASDFATLIHLIECFHKPKASGLVSTNQVSIRYMPIFPMLARIVTGNFRLSKYEMSPVRRFKSHWLLTVYS